VPGSHLGVSPQASGDLSQFLHYLSLRPSLGELCNQMISMWPASVQITDVCIGEVRANGSIAFSGSFKYEANRSSLVSLATVWDNLPPAVAFRDREVLVWADRGEVEEQFPELAAARPSLGSVMAAPLMSRASPYGVFVACSDQHLADPGEALAVFKEYSLVLSLYVFQLLGLQQQSPGASARAASPSEDPRRRTVVPHQMSQRQLSILRLMVEGHTNVEIGRLIGFSESTVRQETMAIYAFLNVSGRRDAVDGAIARGLADITADEVRPAP